MAFRFKLQAVLDHRRHLEDVAKNLLAAQLRVQRECEQHMAWLLGEMSKARQDLAVKEQAGMAAKDFILANEYVTVLRLQHMREQSRLPMLRARTEEARRRLLEATKKCEVLEAVRRRHKADYEEEERRREQLLLDEVAVGAFVRRMNS